MGIVNQLRNGLKVIEKFGKDNAPTILMGVGVLLMSAGTAAAVKATIDAVPMVENKNIDLEEQGQRPMRKIEVVGTCWKLYAPAAIMELVGAGCIITANHMNLQRIAVLTAAAKLNEDKIKELSAKAQKAITGKDPEETKRAETITMPAGYDPSAEPGYGVPGLIHCRDCATGQLFWSTKAQIENAAAAVNRRLGMGEAVMLQDFLDSLGLTEETEAGANMGWTLDINGRANCLLDVDGHWTSDQNGNPIWCVDYNLENTDRPF